MTPPSGQDGRDAVVEALWSRVDRAGTDECWRWRGRVDYKGYGTLSCAGQDWRAHRLSFALHHGPIPDGLVVMHTCDNPPCVNPAHLRVGTFADNNADMVAKGRARQGHYQRLKTQCPRGHLLTGDNLTRRRNRPEHWRECRECHNARKRAARTIAAALLTDATDATTGTAPARGEGKDE